MNWEDFTKLSYEEANLDEMERYAAMASDWKTCVVGQYFPKDVTGKNPRNNELVTLGCLFAGAVRQMRHSVKSRNKKQYEEYRSIARNNIKKARQLAKVS
jgi:hypothetical protein